MNYELKITNYDNNSLRHCGLNPQSPAYNAFNRGIAGQARNDEVAKQGTTNCNGLKNEKSELSHNLGRLKLILIVFSVSFFLFGSCSKKVLNPSKPTKGTYVDREYFGGKYRTVNPNDTITINKYSITGYFTVMEIKERNGFYMIRIQNDSMRIHHSDLPYHIIVKNSIDYQIVSLKSKKREGYEKIKLWQRYKLTINPALVPRPRDVMPSHVIVYIFTKRMWVPVEVCMLDIYTTPNLDGLYYIPLAKDTINQEFKTN